MVNGIFKKCWAVRSEDECYPDLLRQHLSHHTNTMDHPQCPVIFTTPLRFPFPAKLGDKKKKHISREIPGVFQCEHSGWSLLIFYKVDKRNVLLEQWQQSAGRRRRGWPWQITNKRMDKTSLARQNPPWKATVSRKSPETQYSYFIGLLVLLSSLSK